MKITTPLIRRRIRFLPFLPLALLVVLAVRVLRPLVTIRFGPLPSALIGHFAPNPEVYLCEQEAGIYGRRGVDVFYYKGETCNLQLKKMWDRSLHVSQLVSLPDRLNRWLPGGQSHVVPWRLNQDRDTHSLLMRTQPHVYFTEEEERQGAESLRQLGVPDGGNFVCFHARDAAFRAALWPNRDDYHHVYLNSSILNYQPAAEELVRRGYFAFRMGAVVEQPLTSTDVRVIDYANNGRTDFLDIYLAAKCRFFLACASGIDAVSMIFRRPTIYANMVPLGYFPTWGPDDLLIPKKLWLREEGRHLTFREIMNSELRLSATTEQYDRLGIEVIENTPAEITAVAIEMDERLNETWETTEEDEDLQRRFWSLYGPSELSRTFQSRVGTEFLRRNRELLD